MIETDFPFNDVIPSWNIETPPGTGFRVELRLGRREGDHWTPYLYLGTWGECKERLPKVVEDPEGEVNIDYFQSRHTFDRFSSSSCFRWILNIKSPMISRVGLAYSNTLDDAGWTGSFASR